MPANPKTPAGPRARGEGRPTPPAPAELADRLAKLGAPRREVPADEVRPMLAELRERPFSGNDWVFELKYDGYRLIVARESGDARLLYRRGSDVTATFPDVAAAVRALPFEGLVMDGEVVVLDEKGRPSFQRLQKRAQLRRTIDVERGVRENPATAFLFDLVALEGFDLRPLPLVRRKEILRAILPETGSLRFTDHVDGEGEALFEEIGRLGLEGMVAKRKTSPYRESRSADWLKIRRDRTGDFAIVGFTDSTAAQSEIGALHLAVNAGQGLRYAGRVGSGFDERLLRSLRESLEARRRPTPFCSGPAPRGRGHTWVEPELVCEVRFKEWTDEGCLRQPVFLALRPDKSIDDCVAEVTPDLPPPSAAVPRKERTIPFSNLDKIFWPDERYTKGDLIEFYRAVSPWLLPYLRERPLVLTRFPDGIAGKSFYQKDAPRFVPDWIRTERMWSEHAGRDIDYFVCDDVESLLYLVNLGTIPLHVWASRVAKLDRPDWSILDLDPKGAPFADVVKLALAAKRLCDSIGLPAFVKTSGATGLHVLLPLDGRCTYDESRSLAELIARVVNRELPGISTIVRKVSERGGRVYLDYLQNRHGQTIVAPFSVRPLAGAPVSTPLRWNEVGVRLDPRRFTVKTVLERLDREGDPLREVLASKPDLGRALERLAGRVEQTT
jgi:bifunctional non-homologous end joining protein LigD